MHLIAQTISVEYNLVTEGKQGLIDLLTANGYVHYMEFNRHYTHDLIFVLDDVLGSQHRNHSLPILNEDLTINFTDLDE